MPGAAWTALLLPVVAAATLAGCGGGGGSGAAPSTTQLAFSVTWEQPSASTASSPTPGEAAFATVIPPTVNAIRFTLRPSDEADACCISVLRGSQEFTDRRIVLADVPDGPGTLEVNGYYAGFAPADGVPAVCATRPAGGGSPCVASGKAQPSFTSDVEDIDVLPGQTNVVDLQMHSLPFVIDLDPADGATAEDPRPFVRFAIVDANHQVSSDIDVDLSAGNVDVAADLVEVESCRDNDPSQANPPCSEGDNLDVRGKLVVARSPQVLPQGTAGLTIRGRNLASPSRSMQLDTVFDVPAATTTTLETTTTSTSSTSTTAPDTTTTTSTSTSTTSTTTTTDTTTTTLGFPARFCLRFSVANAVDLVGLAFDASYGATGGEFVGSSDGVSCFTTLETNPNSTLATFNDDDGLSRLHVAIATAETFSGPVPVAQCEFEQVPPLSIGAMTISVLEATDPNLEPASATVTVEEVPCPL